MRRDDPYWDEVQDPPMHWDRLGVPISLREWATLMEDPGYKRIAETWVGDRYWISTVWLGLSSDFLGPPMIFETMVFLPDGDITDQLRYPDEDLARQGHEDTVQSVILLSGQTERIDR